MNAVFEFTRYPYNPQNYNSDLIRGSDLGPRPYDIFEEILSRISPNGVLLDIGCGSAAKLLPLANNIRSIIGIDNNPAVIGQALVNIHQSGSKNIHVELGDANSLSFPPGSIDMITLMLCPHNSAEAIRVLKKGGYVIADRVGEQDKVGIKNFFRTKEGNPRGYRTEMPAGEIARIHYEDFRNAGFSEVQCKDEFWQTRYTPEGLWLLLNSTPTIKEFDPNKDRKTFEQACAILAIPDGIILTQHRVLVIARK